MTEFAGKPESDSSRFAPGDPPTEPFTHGPTEAGAFDPALQRLELPQVQGLRLVSELGRGGMGIVYRGKQEFLDREVAVKMLLDQKQNADFAARFKREAKILAGLQHPHIVACYQADVTADGVCFMVMEFVDGPNLRSHLEQHGPLEVADALRVCRDLASALASAQEKQIIHRDVKSENVLLARDANAPPGSRFPFRAKLTDLGLARPQSHGPETSKSLQLTIEAAILGTPLTMSPEQFDDPKSIDHRSDIYGLGCVLYDALVAQPAFVQKTLSALILAKRQAVRGPDPRALRGEIDPEVGALVTSMLAAERTDRPQTYREVIETCERLMLELAGRPARPRRSRTGLYAALGATCVLAGAGVWWAVEGRDAGADTPSAQAAPPERPKPPEIVQAPARKETAPVATLEAPPSVRLIAPPPVEAGDTVALEAEIGGGTVAGLHWSQDPPAFPPVTLIDPVSKRASFVAPESTGDYELHFTLTVTGSSSPPTTKSLTVPVGSDPALAPLAAGELRTWCDAPAEGSVPGWRMGKPEAEVGPLPQDTGFMLKSSQARAWISRPLPRGKSTLHAELQPVGKTADCGLLLGYGDGQRALALCAPRDASSRRSLVAYTMVKGEDGGWSEDAGGTRELLGPVGEDAGVNVELSWNGEALLASWCCSGTEVWTEARRLAIPSRPRTVSLFVAGGRLDVHVLTIKGS